MTKTMIATMERTTEPQWAGDFPVCAPQSLARPLLDSSVFERREKKYLITRATYAQLRDALEGHMAEDCYGVSHVCSLYLDTPEHLLIRNSIEKPIYKEKVRVRSYGVPKSFDDPVFLEIKKKYKGVVYKRRVRMTAKEMLGFWNEGRYPKSTQETRGEDGSNDRDQIWRNQQILDELDWLFSFYAPLVSSMNISCDRLALAGVDDPSLRMTFDTNVRWKEHGLGKLPGDGVNPLLDDDLMIMEAKYHGACPLWLASVLDSLDILPQSFSKYGTAYKQSDACRYFNAQLDCADSKGGAR